MSDSRDKIAAKAAPKQFKLHGGATKCERLYTRIVNLHLAALRLQRAVKNPREAAWCDMLARTLESVPSAPPAQT